MPARTIFFEQFEQRVGALPGVRSVALTTQLPIGGNAIFQKDAPEYAQQFVRTVTIWSEDSQRELDYFVCESEASLAYIANMAAIPLHVWSSRVETLETPDWCILDLDPKDAPFTDVVTVAKAVKALCDDIGLPVYAKTSAAAALYQTLREIEPQVLNSAASPAERRCQNAVVVRDLRTGAERTWRYPDTPDFATPLFQDAVISEIDWAPDSTRLAYTLSYEGDSVAVLNTESDADLGETVEVVVPDGGGNSNHPAWQPASGLLGVFNTRFECCFDDNYEGPPRALLIDVERRLPVPLLPAGRRVSALDFDASGAHLLFVDGGRLYRRSGTQAPVGLVSDVTSVDW